MNQAQVVLWVTGTPQPKGSTRAFIVGDRAITTSTSMGLKAWEQSIRMAVVSHEITPVHGPVAVTLDFRLPRPKSRKPKPNSEDPLKRDPLPDTRPDLDKLVRSVADAISKGVILDDDSKIVTLRASKRYTDEQPGVWLTVEATEGR